MIGRPETSRCPGTARGSGVLRCEETVQRLKAAGLRPTRQRVALARLIFSGGDRHLSAERLHAEAQAADVSVSLATVYNTLHQFTAAGLLREVVVAAGRSYFDTNTTAHHHFFDADTGRLTDIDADHVLLGALPAAPPGMRIDRIDVIVRVRSTDATG